ncbi:hypothetical protein AI28_18945 [bacteria symbiont BFo1 of Frankliniella occidentalis]|nr:hypothetical protein AI28_18945 [bacteria symbiont BFo1 of Frankliniella occidentalis]
MYQRAAVAALAGRGGQARQRLAHGRARHPAAAGELRRRRPGRLTDLPRRPGGGFAADAVGHRIGRARLLQPVRLAVKVLRFTLGTGGLGDGRGNLIGILNDGRTGFLLRREYFRKRRLQGHYLF